MSDLIIPTRPPVWCPDLPKLGGHLGEAPEDFEVEEVPLYQPSGEGAHRYLWVEKRGHNTRDVVRQLAKVAGVPEQEVGAAGLKDRHAVTRQWISLPARAAQGEAPASALEWPLPSGLKILKETLHGNKLRTGHLLANRFWLRLIGCEPDAEARAVALLEAARREGTFNSFGAQRFGRGGMNLTHALTWLRRGAGWRGFQPKLYASVLQAEVFNRYLAARYARGLEAPLRGEVVRLHGAGKHFRVDNVEAERPRWEKRDLHPTGPMPGPKALFAEHEALELERAAAAGILEELPRAFAKLAPGTRRDLMVYPEDLELVPEPERGSFRLSFTLPSGSYATELVEALTGSPARREV